MAGPSESTSKSEPLQSQKPSDAAALPSSTDTTKGAAALEEDDEFEDFPVEDWPVEETEAGAASARESGAGAGAGAGQAGAHLWEESWDDDDDASEDFSKQLKEELAKVKAGK